MQVKLKITWHSQSKYILEKVCKLWAFRSSLIPGMNQSLMIDLTINPRICDPRTCGDYGME